MIRSAAEGPRDSSRGPCPPLLRSAAVLLGLAVLDDLTVGHQVRHGCGREEGRSQAVQHALVVREAAPQTARAVARHRVEFTKSAVFALNNAAQNVSGAETARNSKKRKSDGTIKDLESPESSEGEDVERFTQVRRKFK